MDQLIQITQPLGVFPLPVSYLWLPEPQDDLGREAFDSLLQGRQPEAYPDNMRFFQLALENRLGEALESLAGSDAPIDQYNRFVIYSTPAEFEALQASLPAEWVTLLQIVGYTMGFIDAPPAVDDTAGVVRALVLMANATRAVEEQRMPDSIPLLQEAVDAARPHSPMLTAQLLGTFAETKREVEGASYPLIQMYQEAQKLLEPSELEEVKAETWLNLGLTYQEMSAQRRGGLVEAVKCYQAALYIFRKESHPEYFALCQTQLALAYLTMPMREASDQLRMGIAVQSLREALEIYRPDTHPEQWASAQLNLANALQYLPSSHPEENLIQAVELYEEVLSMRNPLHDPLGHARLQANQANALAHLGIFDHARTKLQSAISIFELYGETEMAASVQGLIDQIAAQEAGETG